MKFQILFTLALMFVVCLISCKDDGNDVPSELISYTVFFARNDTPINSPGGPRRSIYRIRGDGFELTDLSKHPSGGYGTSYPGYDTQPAFSPNGAFIAFRSSRGGAEEIYRMNADGSNTINLTNWPDHDVEFDWSPDGSKIVFARLDSGLYRIFVINNDGTQQTNLTNSAGNDRYPDWSPDGSKISFSRLVTSGSQSFWQLTTMNADGSNPFPLTDSTESAVFSRWSRDGSRIFYNVIGFGMAYRDVVGSGHAMLAGATVTSRSFSPDGSRFITDDLRIVDLNLNVSTAFAVGGDQPSWSSDGKWIVFRKTGVGGKQNLFVVRPDGTDEREITTSQFGDQSPAWKP